MAPSVRDEERERDLVLPATLYSKYSIILYCIAGYTRAVPDQQRGRGVGGRKILESLGRSAQDMGSRTKKCNLQGVGFRAQA